MWASIVAGHAEVNGCLVEVRRRPADLHYCTLIFNTRGKAQAVADAINAQEVAPEAPVKE